MMEILARLVEVTWILATSPLGLAVNAGCLLIAITTEMHLKRCAVCREGA